MKKNAISLLIFSFFVIKDGSSGFINTAGELVIPLIYEVVVSEESGIVTTYDRRYLISQRGENHADDRVGRRMEFLERRC